VPQIITLSNPFASDAENLAYWTPRYAVEIQRTESSKKVDLMSLSASRTEAMISDLRSVYTVGMDSVAPPEKGSFVAACGSLANWLNEQLPHYRGADIGALARYNFSWENQKVRDKVFEDLDTIKHENPRFFAEFMGVNPRSPREYSSYYGSFLHMALHSTQQQVERVRSAQADGDEVTDFRLYTMMNQLLDMDVHFSASIGGGSFTEQNYAELAKSARLQLDEEFGPVDELTLEERELLSLVDPTESPALTEAREHAARITARGKMVVQLGTLMLPFALEAAVNTDMQRFRESSAESYVENVEDMIKNRRSPVVLVKYLAQLPVTVFRDPQLRDVLLDVFPEEWVNDPDEFKEMCEDRKPEVFGRIFDTMPLIEVDDGNPRLGVFFDHLKDSEKYASGSSWMLEGDENLRVGFYDEVLRYRAVYKETLAALPRSQRRMLEPYFNFSMHEKNEYGIVPRSTTQRHIRIFNADEFDEIYRRMKSSGGEPHDYMYSFSSEPVLEGDIPLFIAQVLAYYYEVAHTGVNRAPLQILTDRAIGIIQRYDIHEVFKALIALRESDAIYQFGVQLLECVPKEDRAEIVELIGIVTERDLRSVSRHTNIGRIASTYLRSIGMLAEEDIDQQPHHFMGIVTYDHFDQADQEKIIRSCVGRDAEATVRVLGTEMFDLLSNNTTSERGGTKRAQFARALVHLPAGTRFFFRDMKEWQRMFGEHDMGNFRSIAQGTGEFRAIFSYDDPAHFADELESYPSEERAYRLAQHMAYYWGGRYASEHDAAEVFGPGKIRLPTEYLQLVRKYGVGAVFKELLTLPSGDAQSSVNQFLEQLADTGTSLERTQMSMALRRHPQGFDDFNHHIFNLSLHASDLDLDGLSMSVDDHVLRDRLLSINFEQARKQVVAHVVSRNPQHVIPSMGLVLLEVLNSDGDKISLAKTMLRYPEGIKLASEHTEEFFGVLPDVGVLELREFIESQTDLDNTELI